MAQVEMTRTFLLITSRGYDSIRALRAATAALGGLTPWGTG
jgi:hypothetical protein